MFEEFAEMAQCPLDRASLLRRDAGEGTLQGPRRWNPEGCPPFWERDYNCAAETYLSLESNAQSSVDTYQFEGLHSESTTTSPDLPGSALPFGIQFGRVQIETSVTQTLY